MTLEQIRLVQESFEQVLPVADAAAKLFYARLFDLDPSLEVLFKGEIEAQGQKLMQMLGVLVKSLDRFGAVLPVMRSLGARHATYGVRARDYDTVGKALLWTLRRGLGEAFTAEVEAAWGAVYAQLAGTMKDAARAAELELATTLSY